MDSSTTLGSLRLNRTVTSIDLSNKDIKDFTGMQQMPSLLCFKANGTKICSFKGCIQQKSIKVVSMLDTPVSDRKYFQIMVLIALAPNAKTINGVLVSDSVRNKAQKYESRLLTPLSEGMLIESLSPLTVLDPRSEKIIEFDLDLEEYEMKQSQIACNEAKIAAMKKKLLDLRVQQAIRKNELSSTSKRPMVCSNTSKKPKKRADVTINDDVKTQPTTHSDLNNQASPLETEIHTAKEDYNVDDVERSVDSDDIGTEVKSDENKDAPSIEERSNRTSNEEESRNFSKEFNSTDLDDIVESPRQKHETDVVEDDMVDINTFDLDELKDDLESDHEDEVNLTYTVPKKLTVKQADIDDIILPSNLEPTGNLREEAPTQRKENQRRPRFSKRDDAIVDDLSDIAPRTNIVGSPSVDDIFSGVTE